MNDQPTQAFSLLVAINFYQVQETGSQLARMLTAHRTPNVLFHRVGMKKVHGIAYAVADLNLPRQHARVKARSFNGLAGEPRHGWMRSVPHPQTDEPRFSPHQIAVSI